MNCLVQKVALDLGQSIFKLIETTCDNKSLKQLVAGAMPLKD
mgnify:CR=1 FL=1